MQNTATESKPFVTRRRAFSRVAHYDAALPRDLIETLWTSPESLVDQGEPLQWKGPRKTVRLNFQSQTYVLKRYGEPSRRHALKRAFQTSRAWNTWKFSHRLADAGIATPRPVACIENRWGPVGRDSFLMYPYVEGRTLQYYFAVEARESPSLYDQLWQQIDDMWRQLVSLRVSLEDTNMGNFIICPAGQLWLIDLDKSRFHLAATTAARRQSRAWKQLLESAASV